MIRLDQHARHPDGQPVLFQEQVADQKDHLLDPKHYPWAIACGSVVLQRTGRSQAFPVIERFLNEWSPLRCTNDEPWSFRQLVDCLKPSGLPEIKALRIAGYSREFLSGRPVDLWGLKGYTRDSVLIFTDGKYLTYYKEAYPQDRHLVDYVKRWRALRIVSGLCEANSSIGAQLDDPDFGGAPDRSSVTDLHSVPPIRLKE